MRGPRCDIRSYLYLAVFSVTAALLTNCGGDPDPVVPTTGSIRVTTATSGADQDADGYTVTVDGSTNQAVGASASVTFADVATGSHSVELTGLAANCSATGSNPQNATVTGGGTAQVTFNVSCTALTGNIEIIIESDGANVPATYEIALDGGMAQSIGAAGTMTFAGLDVGDHTFELTVASHCTVSDDNPRTVTIPVATTTPTVQSVLEVTCLTTIGNVEVTVNSSGANIPGGFEVMIDGTNFGAVSFDGTPATFLNLPVGDHTVELVPSANCTVTAPNPRTVNIPSATTVQTAPTTFEVACVSTHGNIEITASSSGANIPGGFTVMIDGTNFGAVSFDGTPATFLNLPVGDHTVELVPSVNCTVTAPNPRTVNIPSASTIQTTQTTFEVACVSTHGNIEITANTTGSNIPGGYLVMIDGIDFGAVSSDGTPATFFNLPVGDYDVELVPSANCSITAPNPRTVNIPSASTIQTAQTTFEVSCT